MENWIEVFVLYLCIISLPHSFPWLMCLPEMPHMMLLLICDLLQLQNNETMPKKVNEWVKHFCNTKHYRLPCIGATHIGNAKLEINLIQRRFPVDSLTVGLWLQKDRPWCLWVPLTSCHSLLNCVLVLLLSPEERKESKVVHSRHCWWPWHLKGGQINWKDVQPKAMKGKDFLE